MILKGSQRAGAGQLSAHLLNRKDNEHVTVHEVRGFAADDLHGALAEAYAISKGTKCKQFMFSLSLNPPKGAAVSEEGFERAADEAERALGLQGQPRAIVFHEKEGRRHAHVVWSRIDPESMRAINLPHFKRRLTELSRELFLENGWNLPEGLSQDGGKNPLNFTLAEWQRAKRIGRDPREIKEVFHEAWLRSDSLKALGNALAERGYFIAKGDRRGIVAIDTEGEVYAVAKWAGVKVREAHAKLGEAAELPSVEAVKAGVAKLVTGQLKSFITEAKAKQARETALLREKVEEMRGVHAGERTLLLKKQAERWAHETQERSDRLHSGLRGLWENITGKARALRAINDAEAVQGMQRDRAQRDELIEIQLEERQPLQAKLNDLRKRHAQERKLLAREVVQHLRRKLRGQDRAPAPESPSPPRFRRRRDSSLDH